MTGSVRGVPDQFDDASRPVIRLGPAIGTWAVGWVGTLVTVVVAIALIGGDLDDLTVPQLVTATAASYGVWAVVLIVSSKRFGTGDVAADLGGRFRLVDLAWAPAGVIAQIWLVPLIYVPLQAWWPDTFSDEQIEERARDLVEGASDVDKVLLVLLVVVGAPLVEEFVYRGLLQRSVAALMGPIPALVLTALWFAMIHLEPIELPGLFLAGLLFGAGVVVTGRIAPGIVAHAAFNAAGLVVVLG